LDRQRGNWCDSPRQHLIEGLKELNMSAAELARQCDVPTKRVSEILDGGPAITSDTALRLAPFRRNDSRILANLQNFYELRIAEKNIGKSIDRLPTLKHVEGFTPKSLESNLHWESAVQERYKFLGFLCVSIPSIQGIAERPLPCNYNVLEFVCALSRR